MSSSLAFTGQLNRQILLSLGVLCTLAGGGCSRLNLWEGPNYRDDPVVSETTRESGNQQPSSSYRHAPGGQTMEQSDEIRTLRANR